MYIYDNSHNWFYKLNGWLIGSKGHDNDITNKRKHKG